MDTRSKMYCLKYDHTSPRGDENLKFRKLQSTFNNSTTIHGIPNVAKARGLLKKGVWTVFTLGCVAAFIYNLYAITNTFLSYHVYAKVDLHHSRKMDFPAVTICNTNPVKKSALFQSSRLQALVANWDTSSTGPSTKRRRRKRMISGTCENRIEPISGICFWLEYSSSSRTYAQAEAICKSAGGKVAIIDTPVKNSHLINTIGSTFSYVWINLAYSSKVNNWVWDGTTPVSWTNWRSGHGYSSYSQTCAFLYRYSNYQWYVDQCTDRRYTLCENTCTGTCFWYKIDRYRTYAEAEAACNSDGGKVAIIDTPEKKSHIMDITGSLSNYNYVRFWINLSYSSRSNKWIWDGVTPVSWTDWRSGHPYFPYFHTTYTCAYVYKNYNYNWYSYPCTSRRYTLCQSGGSLVETTTTVASTTIPETTAETTTIPETTIAPTTLIETTVQQTTIPETTVAPTTIPETTVAPTTIPETTVQQTTIPETTVAPTTIPETTVAPTTIPETTVAPTTIPETTVAPTTIPETTAEPTTIPETTVAPTTIPETTVAPTTIPETTAEPTTIPETTVAPTTIPETTVAPTTIPKTTAEPTTIPETTVAPTTIPETTVAPTTIPETTAEPTTIPETTVASTKIPETTSAFQSAYPNRDPPREDFQKGNDVMKVLSELPDDVKNVMGYNYPEFMLDCFYNNKECYDWHFNNFFDAVYGNCYVFNAGWNKSSPVLKSTQPGRKYGLQMYINLGQNEYMQSISESAGALVVVHNHLRMPFPEDEGVFASPGQLTSIGSRRIAVERLGGDYSNCTEENNDEINVFHEHYGVKYSMKACEKTCYQKNVIDTCHCADPQYPITGKAFGKGNHMSCDARNPTHADCLYGVNLKYIKDELDCNCPLPCSDTLYTYSTSKLEWPSQREKYATLQRYKDKISTPLTPSTMDQYFKRNLLKVEVYLEDISYESKQEVPKYPMLHFFSDIGAIIGLYIGCSILSVLEFIELGLDSLVLLFSKVIYYKKHRKDHEQNKIIVTARKTKIAPLNLREKSINSPREIVLKTGGNNSPTNLTGLTTNRLRSNSRRITTHLIPRRDIEQIYKASRSNGNEGNGCSRFDLSPSLQPDHTTDKNGRWKSLHEKFLFGDKISRNSKTINMECNTDKNGRSRWKPLHLALHEKFLFGDKIP